MKTYSILEYNDSYEIVKYGENRKIQEEIIGRVNILLNPSQAIEIEQLKQDWQKRQFILNNIQ